MNRHNKYQAVSSKVNMAGWDRRLFSLLRKIYTENKEREKKKRNDYKDTHRVTRKTLQ